MKKLLVVIDMQNDFIDGALGTKEAQAIVDNVCKKIKSFDGDVVLTMDTHSTIYLDTQEGRKLPIEHCIKNTHGWQINEKVADCVKNCRVFFKPAFASIELGNYVSDGDYDEVTLIGLCTDICVLTNALLIQAFVPEVPIKVDSSCCAGVTPEGHANAIKAMKCCQIEVE